MSTLCGSLSLTPCNHLSTVSIDRLHIICKALNSLGCIIELLQVVQKQPHTVRSGDSNAHHTGGLKGSAIYCWRYHSRSRIEGVTKSSSAFSDVKRGYSRAAERPTCRAAADAPPRD